MIMQFATTGERRVARKLVAEVLRRGFVVSVYDGEEWSVRQTGDSATILQALCTTEMDTLSIRRPGADIRTGTFTLIWGNAEDGEELIADHSDNDECNAIAAMVAGEIEE